jgi:ribA/ribD-fused uncharacterized protein
MPHFNFSNFFPCDIAYGRFLFPTPENLYQALKTKDESIREKFMHISPTEAKKLGKTIPLREDWEEIKLPVMQYVQERRFEDSYWKWRLLGTKDEELVEYNYWHDNFWGVCTCSKCEGKGQNHLGKIIMGIRLTLLTERVL